MQRLISQVWWELYSYTGQTQTSRGFYLNFLRRQRRIPYLLDAFLVVLSHSCFLTNIPSSSPSGCSKTNISLMVEFDLLGFYNMTCNKSVWTNIKLDNINVNIISQISQTPYPSPSPSPRFPLILPIALMLSSSSSPCSLPVSGADFFLNLKLLNGDLDRVIDFPLFFSDAVLDRRDIMADWLTKITSRKGRTY